MKRPLTQEPNNAMPKQQAATIMLISIIGMIVLLLIIHEIKKNGMDRSNKDIDTCNYSVSSN